MRVWIIGVPGSGKSWLGRRLAHELGAAYHELDAYFWTSGWQIRPSQDFERLVGDLAAAPSWVIDSIYFEAEPILRERAEMLLWIDLPLSVTYLRLLRRTCRRVIGRQMLWESNRETWHSFLNPDGLIRRPRSKHRFFRKSCIRCWHEFSGPKRRLARRQTVMEDAIAACNELK